MKPTPYFFSFSRQFEARRGGMFRSCAMARSIPTPLSHVASLTVAVTFVFGSNASAQNLWTGATSGVLNVSGNYAPGAAVNADGNDTAVFVFGRSVPTNRSLTATSEFKVNRMDFEGATNFTLASTSFFNFIKANNGITQSSSANQTISGGIKVSDGPMTLGGNGTGLVTLSATSNNDYGTKGLAKTGTSAFLISAGAALNTGTVTISAGTLALSSTTTLTGQIQLRGGVLATSGTFSRTFGTGSNSVNFGAGGGGFAAYGGALLVSTALGTYAATDTGNGLALNRPLILGSSIADNVVTLSSAVVLGTAAREIRLVDNTNSANDSAVMSGILSGAGGGLNLTGAGNLSLSGVNTYTGATTIGSGVVLSVATIGNGGVAGNLGQASNAVGNLLINGGTLRYTGVTASTDRSFTLGSGTTSAIHVSSAGTNLTMTGGSAATTGIINKTGDGVLTLSGTSTHTGGTILSAGILRATANAGALGNGTLTLSGGILDLVNDSGLAFGLNTTVTANTQINSRRATAGAGVTHSLGSLAIGAQTLTAATDETVSSGTAGITFGATTLSASGAIFTANASTLLTLGALTGTNTSFTVNGAGNTTIGGIIATGTGTLTKAGAGRLTLLGANSFSGITAIDGGSLQVGDGGTTGTLGGGNVVIATGASLRFNRSNDFTVANILSGAGSVTKLGASVLTLTGTNTFTGGTSINSGAVRIAANANLGAGNITLAGGTLAATETFTLESSRSLFITANSTLDVAATKTLTFNGNLSGTSNLDITGAGILSLGGTSRDYSGLITVSAGELRLTSANLLTNASINQTGGKLVFGGGTPQAPLEVFVPKFSGSGGEITVGENTVAVLSYEGNTLQSYGGQIRGSGGIRKQGSGLVTLSGKNDFTGQADIDDGTLLIDEDGLLGGPAVIANNAVLIVNGAALSTVEVDAGGTLGGNGVIGGFASIEGIHRPGNSPGVQTFADGGSYASTSSFEWDLVQNFSDPTGRGTAYDGVNVTAGQLLIAVGAQSVLRFNQAGSTVNWSNSFWATDQQWLVFDNASAPSGIFGTPSLTVDSAGATLASSRPNATFSWGQTGNDIYLNYSIPEPSAALFTIAGVLGLSLRRRR